MAGIAILLPKESLAELAREKIKEEGLNVKEIKHIVTANSVSEARRAVADGASIIIARGYQASLIKLYTNVPVVEITMTGQDLGILVKKAKSIVRIEHPVIGIVGLSNMFANIDYFDEIFDVTIKKYFGNTADDLQTEADMAVKDKVDIIIGGDTAMMVASQVGIPHLFMESTFDSIREAIKTAQKAIYAAEVEKKHAAQIGAFLDNSFNGIIRINENGTVLRVNRIMEDFIQKKESDLLGRRLTEVLPELEVKKVEEVLTGESEMYSSFIHVKGNTIIFILTVIKVEEVVDGGILSCHIVKKKEIREADTIREMYLHGYVARSVFANIKSKDRNMDDCIELAKLYSLSSNPILIRGEIGSEKNELAECIHNNSIRKNAPFITVNCSDTTEEQQEKVLFGEKSINKTGTDILGVIVTANHGTVLVEEIEHLSKNNQYKLFRAICKNTLINNGANNFMVVDIRIIATTNIDLYQKMKHGEFREDLYYSLSSLSLAVPSLKERPTDLGDMIDNFFKEKLTQYSRYHVLSVTAKDAMVNFYWNGNKLQLERFMDRMILSAKKRTIDEGYVKQLLGELYPVVAYRDGEERIVVYKDSQAEEITEVLEKYHGDRKLVAEELGISKTTLWRHMKKYGIAGKYKA